MRRLTPTVLAAAVATLGLAAAPALATGHGGHDGEHRHDDHSHGATFDHLYVIMLENHSQSSVIGDPNAPYLNTLADHYATATNYYGVTHPSMPNYIAAVAGDNFGIQDDEDENVVNLDRPNLAQQLTSAHIPWGAYMEDLPANKLDRYSGPTTPRSSTPRSTTPSSSSTSVKNSPAEMAKVKDYSALGSDLNGRSAPQFVWISPEPVQRHARRRLHGRRRPPRDPLPLRRRPRTTPTTPPSSRRPTPSSRAP